MTFTFSQADLVNKARNDFLHWCASQDFLKAHVSVAWAFIDAVTKDRDLRLYEGIVSECVERAKQQLLDAAANQPLGTELTTTALEGNFGTLTAVVFENKATLLATLRHASEPLGGLVTPDPSIIVISDEADKPPSAETGCKTTSETSGRRVSSRRMTPIEKQDYLDVLQLNKIVPILKHLMTGQCKKYAEPFWDPVDPVEDDAPDYLDVIKHPMDLDTITKKFNSREYSRASEVKADIELMLANCYSYNANDSPVCVLARQFEAEFRKTWKRCIH